MVPSQHAIKSRSVPLPPPFPPHHYHHQHHHHLLPLTSRVTVSGTTATPSLPNSTSSFCPPHGLQPGILPPDCYFSSAYNLVLIMSLSSFHGLKDCPVSTEVFLLMKMAFEATTELQSLCSSSKSMCFHFHVLSHTISSP